MQLSGEIAEREARRLLPEILGELFDDEGAMLHFEASRIDQGIDFVAEGHGRIWLFQVKSSSSPGLVRAAAERFSGEHADGTVEILVVPFMTSAGAKTATKLGLNWVDLSGNADIRAEWLYISVRGKRNRFVSRGRPASPFAPKSSRVARTMLLDPGRWWRQKDLAQITGLDSGQVSRIVKRLRQDRLLVSEGATVRPLDPDGLLDAWSDEYRPDRHERVRGHASGSGIELARELGKRLGETDLRYALTGLPAAWLLEPFARFRLNSIYVDGDPHEAAERLGLRMNERGANVLLIAPDDEGVFAGQREIEGLPCVSPVQVYLDLQHLPERSAEAAESLRAKGLWDALPR